MKMCRAAFTVCLIVLLLVTSLVGCGSKEPAHNIAEGQAGTSDKVEIKFLHSWPRPEANAYFQEVITAFEKDHPNIKVKMEAVGDEAIKDKLRVMMGTNSQPDIFFSWSGEFANNFIQSNNSLDLTEAFEKDTDWKNRITRSAIEPFTYDGKIYGVPLRTNAKFFVYNKDIFEKNNLSEPRTWDEFLYVLEELKQSGVTPISFGNIYPWAGCHYITGLNQKLVPENIREKDYDPAGGEFSHYGYIEAIEYLKDLVDKGYFNNGFNSIEHNMAIEMFYSGETAMMYLELIEFGEVDKDFKGNEWGFFPLPAIEDGKGNQNHITGAPDGFMISSKTKYPDEAIAFLKFLTSQEMGEKLVTTLGWPSAVIGALNENNAEPYLIKGMKALEEADDMALWLDTDIHIKISDVYLPGLQEVLNGRKTPEALMKEVQEIAKKVKEEIY
ncbi:ABC transporter substrate-binding protein [Alkaliphilus peptidifermentans]|nr:ABC transporter substrate-binding protein [Alkaliphilus peptidifermentans]